MSSTPNHYCPGCGAVCKSIPRYVWYFCKDCCNLAVDGNGRQVECTNSSISGGFQWRYISEDDWIVCRGLYCYILQRDVYLSDARFGGIVAQPLLSRQPAEETLGSFKAIDIRNA